MKKIYSLLLLSALLTLGASKAWAYDAHFYLIGTMFASDNWWEESYLTANPINKSTVYGSDYYIDVELAAGTYYFELYSGTNRYRAASSSNRTIGLDADGFNSNAYYSSGESYELVIENAGTYRFIANNSSSEWWPTVRVETVHTVTVSAGANCTVSKPTTFNASKSPISITPNLTPTSGYYFAGWNVPSGVTVSAVSCITTNLSASANGTITGYCLAAGDGMDCKIVGDMNGWSTTAHPFYETDVEDMGYSILYLSSGSYEFKTYYTSANSWCGSGETYSDNATDKSFGSDKNNSTVSVTTAGYHIFAYNMSNNKLSVFYPGSTYSRGNVALNSWGTICLPYEATILSEEGDATVKFYSIKGTRTVSETKYVVLEEVSSPLAAGTPYIYNVTAAGNLRATFGTTPAIAGANNGLIGTYVSKAVDANYYVIYNGEICKVASGATVNCGANKAFIDMTEVDKMGAAAPGRNRIEMPLAPETATALEDVEAGENIVKFFENGQLLIKRDGITYDVIGRVVK